MFYNAPAKMSEVPNQNNLKISRKTATYGQMQPAALLSTGALRNPLAKGGHCNTDSAFSTGGYNSIYPELATVNHPGE
jgi:hypothetical protein